VPPSVEAESRGVARVLPFLLLALAGCGGGGDDDPDEVRQTVRDFVEATNQRDGETLCGELLTQEYLEKSTLAEGDQAGQACREQLEQTVDLRLRLVSIGKAEVDGDEATVRVVMDTDGVQAPRLFRLEREDGRWKLADGTEG
jgi:predicted lipid-binding transport protein (Tim44 family)